MAELSYSVKRDRPTISDRDWVHFLQTWLPRLGLNWRGYRRVRRQVCRRILRRIEALWLEGLPEYGAYLLEHREERDELDRMARVSISRFFRDQGVFEHLRRGVLPHLGLRADLRGESVIRCWSAGCASGEEPYSLALLWRLSAAARNGETRLEVVATDVDPHLLHRAQVGLYRDSSVHEVPAPWLREAFQTSREGALLRPEYRHDVRILEQDLRAETPDGKFALILCRNLAFTYFDDELQQTVLRRLGSVLAPGGFLVIGAHERLPRSCAGAFREVGPGIFERPAAEPELAYELPPPLREWCTAV